MIDENEQFFISEAVRHARTLNFGLASMFLDGMRKAIGADHPVSDYLNKASRALNNTDSQLELISSGQLQLNLPAQARRKRR